MWQVVRLCKKETKTNKTIFKSSVNCILPVINKIDLPAADPERVRQEVEDVIGLDASEAVLASAKAGIGIEEILEHIIPTVEVTKIIKSVYNFKSV